MTESTQLQLRRRNSQLIINDTDKLKTLDPIIGYAQEPLLPLADACAPLTDVVQDISTYVSIALKHTPDTPADGLTRDESASIRLYTMEWPATHRSLYSILNNTLNNADRQELRPWFKYLKLFLTAIAKIPCVSSTSVWLGVRKHVLDQYSYGTEVTWWAFATCTTTLAQLQDNAYLGSEGERTLFSIEVINGRNIRAHSHFDNEDDILLLPGTSMKVQSVMNPSSKLYIIYLKQTIPEKMLLEYPFEGASLYPKIDKHSIIPTWLRQLFTSKH